MGVLRLLIIRSSICSSLLNNNKMYWADKITQSKPIKSQKLFEGGEFSVVHLSAAIVENAGDARVKLVGKLGKGDDITLASLSKTNDSAKLDFYINCTQQVTLSVVGGNDKTEVHLSGYFEPNGEDAEDDMFYGAEDDEEGEEDLEEDEEDEVVPKAALAKSLKQAKINSNKNASSKIKGSDSDDESDDASEEEEDEEDSSEDLPVMPPKHKPAPAAPAAAKGKVVVQDSDDDSEDEEVDEDLSDDDDDELVDDISDDDDSDEEEADLK